MEKRGRRGGCCSPCGYPSGLQYEYVHSGVVIVIVRSSEGYIYIDIVVNGDSDDSGYGLTARRNGGLTDADERQGVRSGRLTEDRGEAHDDDLLCISLCCSLCSLC